MIEAVISYINTNLTNLNIFKEVKGLTELITEDDKTFPAIYTGKDNLRFITSYDFRNGLIFHLKNGTASMEDLDRVISSSAYRQYSHPMRAVMIHGRNIYQDNNYSQEYVANNIVNAINRRSIPSLRPVIGVDRVAVNVTNYSTNKEDLAGIFENVDLGLRHDLDAVIVDYNIVLRANQKCFDNYNCTTNPVPGVCVDIEYDVFVDSVLVQNGTYNSCGDLTIDIDL